MNFIFKAEDHLIARGQMGLWSCNTKGVQYDKIKVFPLVV